MGRLIVIIAACTLAAGGCHSSGATSAPLPLRHVADIGLPGRGTRFDYEDLDPRRHLLIVAHLGDSQVLAVDLDRRRVVWSASGIESVHGIRVVPELGRVFASATGTDQVVALDESTGAELGRAETGAFPDGVAFDPVSARVFVSDKDGGTVTIVHGRTLDRIGQPHVGGDVGNVQTAPGGGRVFIAVGETNRLLVLDAATLSLSTAVGLTGCDGAHGVAVEPSVARAYVACEQNAALVAVDVAARKVIGRVRVGDDPDVLALDPNNRRLYVAAESGVVTVIDTRGRLRVLGRRHLAPGAHTVAVDSSRGLLALALPNIGGRPALSLYRVTKTR